MGRSKVTSSETDLNYVDGFISRSTLEMRHFDSLNGKEDRLKLICFINVTQAKINRFYLLAQKQYIQLNMHRLLNQDDLYVELFGKCSDDTSDTSNEFIKSTMVKLNLFNQTFKNWTGTFSD